MRLALEVDRRSSCTVLRVDGEVDLATADDLRHALYDVIDGHQATDGGPALVVVDLGGVPFLDSTGIGVLVSAMKRARATGGDLRLAAPATVVRHLLEVAGLLPVFTVTATVDEATDGGPWR